MSVLVILLAILSTSNSGPGQVKTPAVAEELTNFEIQKIDDHTNTRLPEYEKYFKKYSKLYKIPWTLLAAVAYQESKWDRGAVSHTGVRGLMQITSKTAELIGMEDRDDPFESIRGGAFYLRYLFEKTPVHLLSTQRWALALAGYNIGWGHIRDAFRLAHKMNLNPNDWEDMKSVLPMLEDRYYYSDLIYGYARGKETVEFVENVFTYFGYLNRRFGLQSSIADN